jgi:hypothetical protein
LLSTHLNKLHELAVVLVEGGLGTCEQRAHASLVHDVRHQLDLVSKVRLASLRQHL